MKNLSYLEFGLRRWIFIHWLLASAAFSQAQEPEQRFENRTALVICVADYEGAGFHSLPGIDIDKTVMTEALQKTGFEVTTMFNPGLAEARAAVDDFIDKLNDRGGAGFFYFSGHGVVAAKHNHLLFGKERLSEGFSNLWEEAISAQVVLRRMEQSPAQTRIVLLDCCRHRVTEFSGSDLDNPLVEGSFIGYATSGESVPAHVKGSRYTESFARHMLKPGISLEDIQLLVNQDLSSRNDHYWSLPMFRDRLPTSNTWSFNMGESKPMIIRPGQIREFGGIQFAWCPGDSALLPPTEIKDGVEVPGKFPHHSIQNGFWISQTEITRWQWKSLMGSLPESL
ncbi:MAG: caspase family protein, partial [Verrucomicrobiota bacterium]